MNPTLRAALIADVTKAIHVARIVESVHHDGARGRLREVLVGELIRPLLPPTFDIMTGILVDHEGDSATNQSGQEDVLIYSREVLPGGIRLEETGLLPVEACLAVIEVKSRLTASGVRQAIEHASRISRLASAYQKTATWPLPWPQSIATYPLYAVFALGSDLTTDSSTEWERVQREHESLKRSQSLFYAMSIVGRGAACWLTPTAEQPPYLAPRLTQPATPDFAEVISFFAALSDHCRMLRKLKANSLPVVPYSHYLLT